MPTIPAEDLQEMLPDNGMLTPKGYPHPSSKSTCIKMFVRRTYIETLNTDGVQLSAMCATSDIPDASQDDQLLDSDSKIEYLVKEIQPNNNGTTELILEEQ